MQLYLTILAATLVTAWALTPLARRMALRLGIVDRPDVRKVHRQPMPYLGGAAIFATLALGFGLLMLLARNPLASWEHLDPKLYAVLAGAVAMFLVGLWDDVRRLRARYKLLYQLAIAVAMWAAGIRIETIQITETWAIDLGVLGLPLTVLWIAGITNAINLIDGLDGLATGISAISAAAIGYVALVGGQYPAAALLAGLVGALLGFLVHNRHPARIFLGDSGSLLIGFLLSTLAITSATKSAAFVSLAAPFLALGVPILDMCFAMLRRLIERRGLFSPDKNHVHHRLLALGYGHARTVAILWAESAAMTLIALWLLYSRTDNLQRILVFGIVLVAHLLFFRAVGAVRLRDSVRAFREAANRFGEFGAQKRDYDELVLHFRTTRTIDEWWQALELSAKRLGLSGLRLTAPRREGGVREFSWRSAAAGECPFRSTVPVRQRRSGAPLELHVEAEAASLESVYQRMTFLGRLLDTHGLTSLPSESKARPSVPSQQPAPARIWERTERVSQELAKDLLGPSPATQPPR